MPQHTWRGGLDVPSPSELAPRIRPVYADGRMPAEIAAAERKVFPLAATYPGRERTRPAEWEPLPGLKYDRGQQLTVTVGTGGVLGAPAFFAGKPDGIDITVLTGAVVVELQDRLGLNGIRYTLPANTTLETLVSRERVAAFNVADGTPGTLTVTGKWALPAPAVEGWTRGRTDDNEVGELGLTADASGAESRPEARYPSTS